MCSAKLNASAEIFGPICESITEFLQERKHAVLWGNMRPGAQTREKQSLELCDQYIDKRVAGVFFAPLEWTPIDDRIKIFNTPNYCLCP